jgi:hypothetical protein
MKIKIVAYNSIENGEFKKANVMVTDIEHTRQRYRMLKGHDIFFAVQEPTSEDELLHFCTENKMTISQYKEMKEKALKKLNGD